jgi:hypothetical protein
LFSDILCCAHSKIPPVLSAEAVQDAGIFADTIHRIPTRLRASRIADGAGFDDYFSELLTRRRHHRCL